MTKINQLIRNWPTGTIKSVKELEHLGYTPQLLKMYSNSKWIELYTRGAYKLFNDNIEWSGVLYGLQNKSDTTIHVGGRSALELKGYAHYLREGKVNLFGARRENFNAWLGKLDNVEFKRNEVFDYTEKKYFTSYSFDKYEIRISAPELAVMEMLYLIPKEQSFEEAYLIMESLTTLRPRIVKHLLENCNSKKAKRIFMWMAEKLNHTWVEDLELVKVDFGTGKRVIIENGKLDRKYNITVPRSNEA